MRIYLTLFFLTISMHGLMAQGHSFVRHYGKQLSLIAPTWDINVLDDDFALFANGENMLMYENGAFCSVPYPTELRCVYASRHGERIYAGGVNELGYYEVMETGQPKYTSLLPALDSAMAKTIGNVWHIFEYDDNVFFTTDALIMKYSGGRFSVINTGGHIECALMSRGTLYLSVDGSLKFLMGETVRDCFNCDVLKGKMLRGIAGYGSGIVVLSECNGMYYYDGQLCKPLKTSADNMLKASMAFCMAENEHMWAIGTVKSGIVVIDKNTLDVEYIDVNSSLSENTVISLGFCPNGSLWAGHNSGIDHILLGHPINCICPQNYVGIGYDVAVGDSCMHLATNRGMFYAAFSKKSYPNLTPLPGLDGQAWSFCRAFGHLYLLHDKGLFRIDGKTSHKLGNIRGFWGMVQVCDSVALAATYSELYAAVLKKDGTFDFVKQPLDGSYYNMVCDGGDIWLHSRSEAACVRAKFLKSDHQLYDVRRFGIGDGLPSDKNFRLQLLGGAVYAMSSAGVYKFDGQSQRFMRTDSVAGLDCRDGLLAVSQRDNVTVGLKDNLLIINVDGRQSAYYLDDDFVRLHLMTPPPTFVSDTDVVVCNINGFSLANINGNLPTTSKHVISKIFIGDSLVWRANYPGRRYVPQVSYGNDIKFVFSVVDNARQYSIRLNKGVWSNPASLDSKEFTLLREGRYVFQVREIDHCGVSHEDSFEFVILPPWYRSWWAYVLYSLAAMGVVVLITNLVRRHYHAKQEQIEEKNREDIRRIEMQHEMESAADKQRISELEKQKLKDDLEHKTTELADMALSLAGKNEILNTIKLDIAEIIKDARLAAPLKPILNSVTSKIDSNMQNDDLIDRFEEQFNLLHNNFIKKIKELHPELSRNDYMLCAYIRMDLSTKEIAQMLNMSVRGVESQKYRLKKKINLEADLNEYLKGVEDK